MQQRDFEVFSWSNLLKWKQLKHFMYECDKKNTSNMKIENETKQILSKDLKVHIKNQNHSTFIFPKPLTYGTELYWRTGVWIKKR